MLAPLVASVRFPVCLVAALALVPAAAASATPGVDTFGQRPALSVGSDTASVGPVGDVDADGIGDLGIGIVTEPVGDRPCTPPAAEEEDRVLFQEGAGVFTGGPALLQPRGRRVPYDLRLLCPTVPEVEDEGPAGSGISYGGAVGGAVARVGDVNGDGIDDLAVGAAGRAADGRPNAGAVHVVFGARERGEVDLRVAGPRHVRIDGPSRGTELGRVVAGAGDLDGDGLADVAVGYAIGAALPDGRRGRAQGRLAIVYGRALRAGGVDLRSPGTAALVLGGFGPEPPVVAPAGDLDRDGRGDLLVGIPGTPEEPKDGRALVLAGRPDHGVARVGSRPVLMRMTGPFLLGGSVAPAGDVDADGVPDLLVGTGSPSGIVVFGSRDPLDGAFVVRGRVGASVDVATAREGVRRLREPAVSDTRLGASVAGLGDVTGDGVPDLAVGAPGAAPDCRSDAGSAYVVPGDRAFRGGSVDRLPGVWRVDGARAGARLGERIAAAELTGDGTPDLVLPQLPFSNAASSDLHLVPVRQPGSAVPALPAPRECLRVTLLDRSLAAVRAGRALRVRVRSSLGRDMPHRVTVKVRIAPAPPRRLTVAETGRALRDARRVPAATGTLRFTGPGAGVLRVRPGRRARRALRGAHGAMGWIEADQAEGTESSSPGEVAGGLVGLGATRVPRAASGAARRPAG